MLGRRAISLLCTSAWLAAAWPAAADDWNLTRPRSTGPARHATAAPVDALGHYARLLRQNPSDTATLERLVALLEASQGGVDAFAEQWLRESERAPDDALLAEAAARLLVRAGQAERAHALLARFTAPETCVVGALLLRAELLSASGDARGAGELLQRAAGCARAPSERRRAKQALAGLLLAQGDLAGARAAYAALAAEAPADAGLRRKWPEALAQSGHPREAAEAYLALAGRDEVPLLRDAALEFIQAGDIEAALAALERAARHAAASQRAELSAIEEEAYRAAGRTAELAQRLFGSRLPQDRLRAGKLWDELGDDVRAEQSYRAWLVHAPRDPEVLERLARLYARIGKRAEAAEVYAKLLAAEPADVARVGAYAELLRALGREQELPGLLERAGRRAPASAQALRELSELYARFGQVEAQKQALQRLSQLEPRESAHLVALGELLMEQGDREAALAAWRSLATRDPSRARGLSTLADVLGDHDVLDEAVTTMERALELEPEQLSLRRRYASLLERAGRSQAAERAWQWVLERAGNDPEAGREARAHLVSLWKRLGVVPIRSRELAERLRADPHDHAGLRLLAELFARDPKRAEAELALIDRLSVRARDDAEILRALAALHTRRGDADRALPLLERLAELSPESALDHLTRAVELALAQYRDAEAERYARRAVALRPRDAAAYRLLGSLHVRRQQTELAVAAYARAAELDPRDIATWIRLGELAEARADMRAAHAAWLQVLARAADDEQVTLAAHKLMAGQADGPARLHEALLEGLRRAPQRAVFRRLLVESYGRALGAAAKPVSALALRPLLDSLDDDDATLRRTAIGLLAAARAPSAVPALLAQAEKSASRAERAQALIAVGRIADGAAAAPLRGLLPRLPAPLRPIGLWALVKSRGPAAAEDCLAQLSEADAGVRAMAALCLAGVAGSPAPAWLRLLEQERHPGVRAAALWGLAGRAAEQRRELFLAELDGAWPIPAAALRGLQGEADLLARALLDADTRIQDAAAVLWNQREAGARPADVLAVPSWPFEARAYVAAQLSAHAAAAAPGARLSTRDGQLLGTALAEALDRGGAAAEHAVSALGPAALVPRALAARGFCASPAFSSAVLQASGPALERRAVAAGDALGARALLLLARSAEHAHPAVLRALSPAADGAARTALLRSLVGRRDLPQALRARLLWLFDHAPDWPTRLRVAEVVGRDVGAARARNEPVALVRAAIGAPAASVSEGFCANATAAN